MSVGGTVRDQEAEALVLALDEARARALVEVDLGALERLIDDDYTHVESNGRLRGKRDFIDGLETGTYRFASFDIEENRVRLFGCCAVVSGRYSNIIVRPTGERVAKRAFHLRVYVRREGDWRNVAHQATEACGR